MKTRLLFYITLLCSFAIILGEYFLGYSIFSYDYIPLGWDTAIHMSKAISIRQDFLTTLLAEDFINILYPLLMSPFAFDRYFLYLYETFIPPIILISLAFVCSKFEGLQSHLGRTIFYLAFPSWLIVYRFLADLHPALLGTTLSMLTVNELIKSFSQGELVKHKTKIMMLITLSSMAHIETADFFLLSLVAALILIGQKKLFLKNFQLFLPLIIMNLLYIYHLSKLWALAAEGDIQEVFLLNIIGLFFAMATLVIFYHFLKKKSLSCLRIEYAWLLAMGLLMSLIFFMSVRFVRFYPYLERAILTFPLPLMVGMITEKLVVKKLSRKIGIAILFITIALLLSGVIAADYSKIHLKTWIAKESYYSIIKAKSYNQSARVIFLFYDEDKYAGGLATLYDSWITILYGKHYSYLGTLQNLIEGKETKFQTIFSKEISKKFYLNLLENSIIEKIRRCDENINIVIIRSFYKSSNEFNCDVSEGELCLNKLPNICHQYMNKSMD